MVNKWTVYAATYATYSAIHSIRTCFASLKTMLNDEPYEFSEKFLGAMDMFVLLTIAILLYIFGGEVEKYPRRKILFPMMIGLILNLILLFIFLLKENKSHPLYFIFYGTIGVFSSLSWPVCLYTTSQYFDSNDAIALSMYSSVSQCGDFLAFLISLLVISAENVNGAYSMLILAIIFVAITGYDYFFFRDRSENIEHPSVVHQVESAHGQVKNDIVSNEERKIGNIAQPHVAEGLLNNENQEPKSSEIEEIPQPKEEEKNNDDQKTVSKKAPKSEEVLHREDNDNENNVSSNTHLEEEIHPEKTESQPQPQPQPELQSLASNSEIDYSKPPVNLFTVWVLPGVALPVLALASVKAINAIIVSWLVFYFNKLDMVKESRVFAIAWTCSIVVGGFIGAKINSKLSYKIFIVCLFISGFVFFLLEELHMHPNEFEVIALVIICAVLVGGPYNQLTTAVPLKLCEDPEIRSRPKAKSAIISLMEGFAIFICGISVLIVPSIGISRLHKMASALCFISVVLLSAEEARIWFKRKSMVEEKSENKGDGNRKDEMELKEEV